jgi:hypothetical protein
VMRAESHGRIDDIDRADAFIERIDRLVDHRPPSCPRSRRTPSCGRKWRSRWRCRAGRRALAVAGAKVLLSCSACRRTAI